MRLSTTAEEAAPPVGKLLDAGGAYALTERIRTATHEVCMLLHQAHQGRAWLALGYRSWGEYVRSELGLSRSRSYEFLNQAHVIRTIQAETGVSEVPDVSTYRAGQIRRHLTEFLSSVRARCAGVPPDQMMPILVNLMDELRDRLVAGRPKRSVRRQSDRKSDSSRTDALLQLGSSREHEDDPDALRLGAVIRTLATMPPAVEVAAQISDGDFDQLARLQSARARLCEIAVGIPLGGFDGTA
jgi:hypothetical protein